MNSGYGVFALSVLLVISASTAAISVTAAQPNVTIESVDPTVAQPAPGEAFTLETTVTNLESSSGPVKITEVYVQETGTETEYARVKNVGSFPPGTSLSIPLTLSINEPGEKQLTVFVRVKDSNGNTKLLQYRLFVDIEHPNEAIISFADVNPVVGQQSSVNVTISNGDNASLSNVRLNLGGDGSVENGERVVASMKPGTQTRFTFDVTFSNPGEHTLNATLTYETNEGVERTIHREVTTQVESAKIDTELVAKATESNGSSAIQVSLTEFGNAELRDILINIRANGQVVSRSLMADVGPKETRSVTIDGSNIPAGNITIVARFSVAGEQRSISKILEYSPVGPTDMILTGIEVSRRGSNITVTGEVANVGSTSAKSVLLAMPNNSEVSPRPPNKKYFVGTIETSGFATFQLNANVSREVQNLPIQISYSASGERFSKVIFVSLSPGSIGGFQGPPPGSSGSSAWGALLWLLGGILLVLVIGYGIYRRNRL